MNDINYSFRRQNATYKNQKKSALFYLYAKFSWEGIVRENLDASWFNNVSYYLNNKKNINVVAGGYWQSCWYDALDKYFIGG